MVARVAQGENYYFGRKGGGPGLWTGPDAPNPPLRGVWVENAPRFRPRRDPRRVPRFGRGAECARMVLLASYLVLWNSANLAGYNPVACRT